MSKQAFTAARVESLACEAGKQQTIHWDAKTPGFGMRVTATGARSYIFESRLFGNTIRTTVGDARAWELSKARAEATRLKNLIDNGIDPREHRAELAAAHAARQTAARRREITLGEAWDEYVAARKQFWSDRHHEDHVKHAADGGQARKRGKGRRRSGPCRPRSRV